VPSFLPKSAHHLLCKGGRFYFRRLVPHDLRPLFGKGEIKYSLGVVGVRGARIQAEYISYKIGSLFQKLRNLMKNELKDLSGEDISTLLDKYFDEIHTVRELVDISDNDVLDKDEYECLVKAKTEQAAYFKKVLLKLQADGGVESMLDGYLRSCDIEPDHEHQKYDILKRGFIIRYKKYFENLAKRYSGESTSEDEEKIFNKYLLKINGNSKENSAIYAHGSKKTKTQKKIYILSEVWGKYKDDKIKNDNKRASTLADYEKFFQLFIEITGDINISDVDKSDIRSFREVLLNWPKNKTKNKKYKDKTTKEIMEMDIPESDKITEKTRRNYLCALMSFWTYAETLGYTDDNPIKGFGSKIRNIQQAKIVRPFTNDELNKIFTSPIYVNDDNKFAYRYWIPLIALFTGARLNEICQLYLDDVREVDGVWVFDVNNNKPDKQIKNDASKRLVPIHPFLLNELKILNYVDKLTKKREQRLFPELKPLKATGKYNHAVSKWFAFLKEKIKLIDDSVNFHSFRKTYANFCKQNKVRLNLDEHMYKRTLGHALNDMTADVYGNEFSPQLLYENIIVKINFDEVDFSHVLRSKFIVR